MIVFEKSKIITCSEGSETIPLWSRLFVYKRSKRLTPNLRNKYGDDIVHTVSNDRQICKRLVASSNLAGGAIVKQSKVSISNIF